MECLGVPDGASDDTYRRALKRWIDQHYHIWVFNREGAASWSDKVAFYIERDYSVLNVGDILVRRRALLEFRNFKSLDRQAQAYDFNTVLRYGVEPAVRLGDFAVGERPGHFERAPAGHLEAGKSPEGRLSGQRQGLPSPVFPGRRFGASRVRGAVRGGSESRRFSPGRITGSPRPWSGSSGRSLNWSGFRRPITGTSIEHKPPRLKRGERLHRKVYEKATGGRCLTLEQAHRGGSRVVRHVRSTSAKGAPGRPLPRRRSSTNSGGRASIRDSSGSS